MYADMYLLNRILNHLLRLGFGPPFEQDNISRIISASNTFFSLNHLLEALLPIYISLLP